MKAVADNDGACPTSRLQQTGCRAHTVVGGSASLFGQNVFITCAVLNEIFLADLGFGKVRIRSVTAGCDDRVSETVLIQLQSMIESGLENGRRSAVILSRAQYND